MKKQTSFLFGLCSILTWILIASVSVPLLAQNAQQAQKLTSDLDNKRWSRLDTLTHARRAYVVAQVYHSIQQRFAHWQGLPDFAFEKAFQKYLTSAFQSKSREQFSLTTTAFVAQLKNSHTYFVDNLLTAGTSGGHGFSVRCLGGEWVITSSRISELRPGDTLDTIGDESVEEFYRARNAIFRLRLTTIDAGVSSMIGVSVTCFQCNMN